MKKTSKVIEKNKPKIQEINPIIFPWVIYLGLAIWGWFVLSRYHEALKPILLDMFISWHLPFIFSKFLPRIMQYLVNIFYITAIFFASCGIGSLILKLAVHEKSNSQLKESDNLSKNDGIINLTKDYNGGVDIVFSIFLGLGVIATLVFLAGLIGLLNKLIFAALIFSFAFNGCFYLARNLRFSWPKFSFSETLAIIILAFTAFLNFVGACAPETFYDAQHYQTGMLNMWIHEGKISSGNNLFPSYMPFNVNMLYLLGMLIYGQDMPPLMHFFFGIFLVLSIYVFSKRFFTQTIGIFAALIFYTIPNVIFISQRAGVELGIGLFEFGTVFAIMLYLESEKRYWLLISALFCGFALGSKYTSIAFCFIPAIIVLILIKKMKHARYQEIAKDITIFSVIAIIVFLPWLLRNTFYTGDPVFPFFWQKIGWGKMRIDPSYLPYPQFTIMNYLLFLWPLTMGVLQEDSFPGVFFLLFIPLLFVFKKIDIKIKILLLYSILSLFFWIFLGKLYMRFFVPSMAVVSVIFSYFLFTQKRARFFKVIIYALLFFSLFYNISFSNSVTYIIKTPVPFFMGLESKKDYLSTQRPSYPCPYYQIAEYINLNTEKKSKILLLGETRGLFLERKFLVGGPIDFTPVVEWANQSKTKEDFISLIKKNGFTHILLNVPEARRLNAYDMYYWRPEGLKVFCEFWQTYVKQIYKDIADISILRQGIFSIKKQQPQWWAQYSSNPKNYVYLYEIMNEEEASKPHVIPQNFFLEKELYSRKRWEILENIILKERK